jgi:hypothetical protein
MNEKKQNEKKELKTDVVTEETRQVEISAEELREVIGGYAVHEQAMTCGDYNI